MQDSDDKFSVFIDYNNIDQEIPVEVLLDPQTNNLHIKLNAVAIENHLLKIYNREDITSDLQIQTYYYFIEEGRKLILNKDINSWGNINERNENVHDNSVNISLKSAYKRIVEENTKDNLNPIHVKNILSYFYFCKLNLINNERNLQNCLQEWINILNEFVSCDISDFENAIDFNYNKRHEFINDIKEIKTFIDKEIFKLEQNKIKNANCFYVINYIAKNNEFIMNLDDNEMNVLINVWKRIHSPKNNNNLNNLLEQFTHEMALLVENQKMNSIQCASGRVASLISSLELFDCDNLVDIKSVPVLRVMMVQNRAPVIIDELIKEYRNLGNNLEVERYLINGDNCDKLVDFVKQGIIRILTEEFGDKLSNFHMDKFLAEILNEI